MLDERGGKKRIIPAEVVGHFRAWRTRVYFVLLVIFLALPWISINGTQAVLFDIPNRHFELFGLVFLSHDSPIFFFFVILFALGLFTATALWGRVWCGWACPQTVFIDAVYRRIEIWIEGDYIQRRRLAEAPLNGAKFFKLLLKWSAYLVVSSLIAHSFIAYFAGSRKLVTMMQGSPQQNWEYFLIVSFVTGLLLFNFGWFREQFCIIMCPYGRFQNILMDQQSVSVVYDRDRGEPRKGLEAAGQLRGDCVSCNACVQVCPTGIDIRDGLQIECIACTACIDACDEIMTKVKKPQRLIGYSLANPKERPKLFRPRVAAYLTLIVVVLSGLIYTLAVRLPFSSTILRAAKEAPYTLTQDGLVMNHFKAHLFNQSRFKQNIVIALPDELAQKGVKLTQAIDQHELKVGESKQVHLFVSFPPDVLDGLGTAPMALAVRDTVSGESRSVDVKAIGPLPK